MKHILLSAVFVAVALAQPGRPVDEFATSAGPIRITIINHATMMVEGGGQVIHVDPIGAQRYVVLPQADVVLITHTHPDHVDAAAVEKLKKTSTIVLAPESVAKALPGTTVIRNGENRQIGGWRIEAVPAYNLTAGFHPKGDGNGYVLTFGDKRFYIAGDTQNIPELAALKNIEAAFLPVNQPYTMTPEEAAAAARVIRPKYVYPYHSRGSDLGAFGKLLEGSGIEVRLRDWYQPGDDVAPAKPAGAKPQGAKPAAAKPAPLVSPQVLPDQRVIFRLRAPNAREVTIAGDFWLDQSRSERMVKDDQGVWSITLGPFFPDVYSYYFSVDGTSIADPANGWTKPGVRTTQSAFEVPGPEAAWLAVRNVPHGEVRIVYYQSSSLDQVRRMHIYFPPGYDASGLRYPVLYLLHGGGDTDDGWTAIGRAHLIMDNLLAGKKAKPMIIVMPNVFAVPQGTPTEPGRDNVTMFGKDLFGDVIPYVEKNYRVLNGSANRAIGGLSMPNILPDIWIPNIEKFDYIGFTSNGLSDERLAFYDKTYPGVLDNPSNVKRVRIFIGDGVNAMTFSGARNLAERMKQRGYNTSFNMTNGIHGWPWFRRYFAEFAQLAFQ